MTGDDETITGACRCGQVTLTVQGPAMLTMACHCTGCQRMTASAYSLSAMFHQDAVTVTGDTIIGGMKGDLKHHFCPNCLSWLFTRAEMMGPLINVRSTMLDRPMSEPPFIECWLDESLPWARIGARHGFGQFPPSDRFEPLIAEFAAARG